MGGGCEIHKLLFNTLSSVTLSYLAYLLYKHGVLWNWNMTLINAHTGVLINPYPDQEWNKLQRQKILSSIYPIYYHNWRNISTIYIYIYMYIYIYIYISRLASNEIFSPSNEIHRELGRAKDLSTPRYVHCVGILCCESYVAPVLAERAIRDRISGNGAALKKHTAGFSETLSRIHLPTRRHVTRS